MVFYHLQHYFALDDSWHDIPHVNGGMSTDFSEIYERYLDLINLKFTKVSEYRIIVSGISDFLPLSTFRPESNDEPIFVQLSLFD